MEEECKHNLQKGICALCGTFKSCNMTSEGWICTDCLSKEMHAADPNVAGSDPKKFPCRIIPMPCHHRVSWVLMDGREFITINGVLYCFDREEDAQKTLRQISTNDNMNSVKPRQIRTAVAALYVMQTKGIMLFPIKEVPEGWV